MTELAEVRTCASGSSEATRDPSAAHKSRLHTCLGKKLTPLLPKLDLSARDALVAQATVTLLQIVEDVACQMQIRVSEFSSENVFPRRVDVFGDKYIYEIKKYEIATRLLSIMSCQDILLILLLPQKSVGREVKQPSQATQLPIDSAPFNCAAAKLTRGMLENQVVAVQEATIDAMQGQCTKIPSAVWSNLSSGPTQFLMQSMVDYFFEQATATPGLLTPALRDDQQRVVAQLLACTSSARTIPDLTQAMERAKAMRLNEQLDEQGLIDAIRNGESRMATAMLAVAADLPASSVDRAASLRSAKGLVSIVWKAGFSMRVAVPLQMSLARLSPITILHPNPGGGFPLAVDEMRWQIDFFAGNLH